MLWQTQLQHLDFWVVKCVKCGLPLSNAIRELWKKSLILIMLVCSQNLSPVLTRMTKEVDAREKELTHQVHRDLLIRSLEQVKNLTPVLISGIKIFITAKQTSKWWSWGFCCWEILLKYFNFFKTLKNIYPLDEYHWFGITWQFANCNFPVSKPE